jgi:hypothetical protein
VDPKTPVAWLSSARAVRCLVKSSNERNPHPVLPSGHAGDSRETAPVTERKVGTTSSQHGGYAWGFTHATMGETKGCKTARWS